MKFFFDTETTGLNPKSDSILTLAGVVLDDDLDYRGHIYLEMQPAKSIQFTANLMQALAVNRLNPNDIFSKMTADKAFAEISKFLAAYSSNLKPLIPVGHNVKFDLAMLESDAKFLGLDSIMKMLHYHTEDTMSLAQIAKNFCGQKYKNVKLQTVFEATKAANSDFARDLFKNLNLSDADAAHNSLYDIYMTICIYKYFKDHFTWKE